jgi:hypothetical protein
MTCHASGNAQDYAAWASAWACDDSCWQACLGWPLAGGQHEATAEEIKAHSPKHLVLQHFEVIDIAFDRPIGPGQRHARFDRRIVVAEPVSKAL